MPENYINKLTQIDSRLQLINEERLVLLKDRQALITQHEAELAQNFNLYASPESKIDLFLSYFKGRNDVYPFRWASKNGRRVYSPACWNEWQPKFAINQRLAALNVITKTLKYRIIKLSMVI